MFKPIAKPEEADLFKQNVVDINESLAHKQELLGAMFPRWVDGADGDATVLSSGEGSGDADIYAAITALMDAKDDSGGWLFKYATQWQDVYRF